MLIIGCGNKTQPINTITINNNKIPAELLTLEPLEKPLVENDIDIINAYSTLFLHYKQCIIKIEKIKDLNN